MSRPLIVAPAMNTDMWNHPVTARHIQTLKDFGFYHVIMPVAKVLACGDVGMGAMAPVDDIVAAVLAVPESGSA